MHEIKIHLNTEVKDSSEQRFSQKAHIFQSHTIYMGRPVEDSQGRIMDVFAFTEQDLWEKKKDGIAQPKVIAFLTESEKETKSAFISKMKTS